MRNRALLPVLLVVFTITGSGAGPKPDADAPPVEDPALAKRLESIDSRAAKITDLAASFRQEKFTALLRKPLVSSGTVRVKGSKVRWDTAEPEPAVLFSDGRELRLYYPGQKLLEIYPIDQRLSDLAASPLPRLATLRRLFTIEEIPVAELDDRADGKPERLALRMVPRDESLREHVGSVRALLDVGAAHILKVETTDADEDRTVITFSDVKLNAGLKDEELDLVVPDDVKVSRPLEGGK